MRENQKDQDEQQILDKRKRMRKLELSFVGIVLIIFSLIIFAYYTLAYQPTYFNQIITSGITNPNTTPSTGMPTPTPTLIATGVPNVTPTTDTLNNDIVLHTPISNIRGVVIIPYKIEKNRSIDINVTLISLKNVQLVLTDTPRGRNQRTTGGLVLLGSPNVPIMNSYGEEYNNVFATALLNGAAFTIQPSAEQTQTLDQKIVSFHWSVLANEVGQQTLEIRIIVQWKSKKGGDVIEQPILQKQLLISVDNGPFLSPGQITLSELLVAFIGSALNLPWILDYIQKRREAKGKKQASSNRSRKKTRHR